MNDDGMIDLLAGQVAQLRSKVEELEGLLEEARGDTMDDVFLHIKNGPVIGGGDSQGAFAVVDGKITNRHYMVARTVHTVSGNDPDAEDGTWYLVVPHANPGSATLTTSPSGMPGDTQTLIPLFTIYNRKITADYRGMPLVMIRE